MNNNMQRIIGKHALIIAAKGQTELAAQVFVYDQIREVRVDLEKLEVRVLMAYDKDYFRVFAVQPNENLTIERAKEIVVNFYNNLLNASMKLSEEEVKNLRNQQAINTKVREQLADKVSEETKEEEKENE